MLALEDFPECSFPVILADPPWRYYVYSARSGPVRKGRAGNRGIAERHYPTMAMQDICRLPVNALGPRNAALFLWTTAPCLWQAHSVMAAWGYDYRTVAFVWTKVNQDGLSITGRLGHYTRSSTEFCLLGIRGRMKRRDTRVEQSILAPRGLHSAKPAETYRRIERLFEGPYLELFARGRRENWTAWGDEL